MIASFLLLFSALTTEIQNEPVYTQEEIVVIGERLRGIAVNVGRDPQGNYHCSLSDSTGYPNLDERLCKAVTKCVRKGALEDATVKKCINNRKPVLMRQLKNKLRKNRK